MEEGKPNILYIDDEPDNLTVFKIAFRRYYNILTSTTAAEGLEILQKNKIHVVVTDQRMPDMTGVEFLTLIPAEPYVTRILLTAYTETQALIDAVNDGHIFRYINKPWKLDDLKQTLDNAVENQKLIETNHLLLRNLKASNQQLEKANEELRVKNRLLYELDKAKSEFINIISHEIKTPLNGIIGLTRLLSSQIEEEEYKEFFNALKFSVDRLDEFAKNAIFLTQLETQTYKVVLQEHNLKNILDLALTPLFAKAQDKSVAFDISNIPEKLDVRTDGVLLQKCMTTVLDNAVRYSPEGATIKVEATIDDNQFIIRVMDEGPGFSDQALERLFKYFGIGDVHYDQQVGLGLSLVNMGMTSLGGQVKVKNVSEQGALVELCFPDDTMQTAKV